MISSHNFINTYCRIEREEDGTDNERQKENKSNLIQNLI